jgi:hypothetical protein
MNILVNGNTILLHFPTGRNLADPQIRLLECIKNIAAVLVYGSFEVLLFHLLQNPSPIDELNYVCRESLQGHSPCQPGMTLKVSDEKQTV